MTTICVPGNGTLPETSTIPPGASLVIGEPTSATMMLAYLPPPPSLPSHPHPHRGKRRRRWA